MKRLFLISILVLFSVGCAAKAPDGFPDLRPAKIRVLDDTTPVPNVNVVLYPEGHSLNYLVAATTDANGLAVIRTERGTFSRPGAPEGTYKIALSQLLDIAPSPFPEVEELTAAELAEREKDHQRRLAEAEVNRKVPVALSELEKTPFQCTITDTGLTLDIDVSQYKEGNVAKK